MATALKAAVQKVETRLRPRREWMSGSWLMSHWIAPKMMMKCCSVSEPEARLPSASLLAYVLYTICEGEGVAQGFAGGRGCSIFWGRCRHVEQHSLLPMQGAEHAAANATWASRHWLWAAMLLLLAILSCWL
jgi:hypothetical protein